MPSQRNSFHRIGPGRKRFVSFISKYFISKPENNPNVYQGIITVKCAALPETPNRLNAQYLWCYCTGTRPVHRYSRCKKNLQTVKYFNFNFNLTIFFRWMWRGVRQLRIPDISKYCASSSWQAVLTLEILRVMTITSPLRYCASRKQPKQPPRLGTNRHLDLEKTQAFDIRIYLRNITIKPSNWSNNSDR